MILDLLFSPDVRWEERPEDVLGKIESKNSTGDPTQAHESKKSAPAASYLVIDLDGAVRTVPQLLPGMQRLRIHGVTDDVPRETVLACILRRAQRG